MSKPIKVVVVVLLKKKLGKNNFWSKKIDVQKNWGQKVLDPKKIWEKIDPKNFSQKQMLSKKILKIFGYEKNLGNKNLR